jgi:LPXTG-motif cell wall-anchored protein
VLATDTDVTKGGQAHVFTVEPNGSEAAYDANATAKDQQAAPVAGNRPTDLSADRDRTATGTSGAANQNPAPRQQASSELPKTASPLPLIGLLGLMALAGGFGLRRARSIN